MVKHKNEGYKYLTFNKHGACKIQTFINLSLMQNSLCKINGIYLNSHTYTYTVKPFFSFNSIIPI